jgi:tRNA/rRNA methyltransferase
MLNDPLRNITIVLVRPQYAGNIGSVCRAMKNMGLSRLILVSPEQDPLSAEARMMATSAKDILHKAKIFSSLEEALQGFRWIAGTSARKGINRGPFISPREISPEILQHARSIPVAILFGPEDRGLTNRELDPCHALVQVPTHSGLSSLNLAQAVMNDGVRQTVKGKPMDSGSPDPVAGRLRIGKGSRRARLIYLREITQIGGVREDRGDV